MTTHESRSCCPPRSWAASDVQLPLDASAARIARSWVANQLDNPYFRQSVLFDEETRFDILLCTSELVNASMMAGSTHMVLRLALAHPRTVISLFDDCVAGRDPSDPRVHAHLFGLQLLDSLAHTWGIAAVPDGREMWVEFTDGPRSTASRRPPGSTPSASS